MFIAADAQGRGVGSSAARMLAADLTGAGWVPVTVDPALGNARAIRAWRAAGFVEPGEPVDEDGALVQVVTCDPRRALVQSAMSTTSRGGSVSVKTRKGRSSPSTPAKTCV